MEYIRYCPKCNVELKTENKYWHIKCEKRNSLCLSCSLKGRIFTDEWKLKLKQNHANITGKNNPFYNKKHSNSTLESISNKQKKNWQLNPERWEGRSVGYNKLSIPIIEEYGKQNGFNFQHAENGGEFQVPGTAFKVDGYDKEKNVVLEYDEPKHFKKSFLKKDKYREKIIQEILKCKIIRIKYTGEVTIINYEN